MTTTESQPSRDDLAPSWLICDSCRTLTYRKRFVRLARVCPECGRHARLDAPQRIEQLLDPGSASPIAIAPTVHDPLQFVDQQPYSRRLASARAATGHPDAVRVLHGSVHGRKAVVAVMDFRFIGGSLGVAAGEAVTGAAEAALAERSPLLLVTASGGARMQEGALALLQMAKTSNAMAELDEAGLLTVTLVTDPTYGGVAASFASLSDVIVAEPGARMGFAGPRVIQQTIGQQLPDGFQTAEFLLEHGLVDEVLPRGDLRHMLGWLFAAGLKARSDWGAAEDDPVVRQVDRVAKRPASEVVALARHIDRPTTFDHIGHWLDGFVELHGDRLGADCPAIVGGIGHLDGLPLMLIGQQKGHTTAELVRRNFGMPSPAGYRKAARLMSLADKLGLPIVTLVDTPGAYPGVDAERGGQSIAIAECLRTLGGVGVPVVNVVTGEGGSGGALALGSANRMLVCANATYSVISPEGCAAILWKRADAAATAADALRVDARSLLELGIVDGVVPEPDGGAHTDPTAAADLVRRAVISELRELRAVPAHKLVRMRRERFRQFGLLGSANGELSA